MDVKEANNDIQLIKEILNQTQYDISKTGNFFVWVGIINMMGILVKEIGYFLLDSAQEISRMFWLAIRSVDILLFIIIVVAYLIYYSSLIKTGNDLSKSVLKIWGILIIGGKVLLKIFFTVFSEVYNDVSTDAVNGLEKFTFFLLIIIGFLFMGILVHDKKITGSICVCVLLYFILLCANIDVAVGNIPGNSVKMDAHDVLLSVLLSIGMIISGIYIRRRRVKKGGTQ